MKLPRAPRMFLLSLLALGMWAWTARPMIEIHRLERALQPGYDAFGRNCIFLAAGAMAQTFFSILPVLAFTLAVSFFLAFSVSLRSDRIRFGLRSLLDTVAALPGFLIALALGVLIPASGATFFLGGTLLLIPSTTRFFESQILKIQGESFVLAAEAMGAARWHIWLRHLFPLLGASLSALLPYLLQRLILIETSLSFLGLSTAPEHESWGRLLAQGKDYLLEAPWILAAGGVPLFLILSAFHLLSAEEKN